MLAAQSGLVTGPLRDPLGPLKGAGRNRGANSPRRKSPYPSIEPLITSLVHWRSGICGALLAFLACDTLSARSLRGSLSCCLAAHGRESPS